MTAAVLSLTDRLPPEAPVRRDLTLQFVAYVHLLSELAINLPPPSPSELIDALVHETDPTRRQQLADAIARSAP